ncbi:mannosyltransferase putative-domain-containing protein [Cladochytrium replicatum]|nr:mannosyltransferase putative-domain-containing protein [Cladochytrium replicatum]
MTMYFDSHFNTLTSNCKTSAISSESQTSAKNSGSSPPPAGPSQLPGSGSSSSSLPVGADPMQFLNSLAASPQHKEVLNSWIYNYQKQSGRVGTEEKQKQPKQQLSNAVVFNAGDDDNDQKKVIMVPTACSNASWSDNHMVWNEKMDNMPKKAKSCTSPSAKENIEHNIDRYFMENKQTLWNQLNSEPEEVEKERTSWQRYIQELNPIQHYIDQGFYLGGKGIVFTAHKSSYRRCIRSIRFIRALGCNLPIEVFYMAGELDDSMVLEVERESAVAVRDLLDKAMPFPSPPRNESLKRNFQVKSAAIINSAFTKLIYLDSDNVPMKNPEYLFEVEPFKRTGAIMWPDFWKTHYNNPIWKVMDVPCRDEWEVEAGQLVLDKVRNWEPLQLAHYMQSHYDLYFRLLNGDKDTFRFGFLALNREYFMTPHFLASAGLLLEDRMCGNTMVQLDPIDGSMIFAHMNLVKDLESDGMVEARPREFVVKQYRHPEPWDPRLQPDFYATHVGTKDVPCVDLKVAPHVRSKVSFGWFVDHAPAKFFDLYDQFK